MGWAGPSGTLHNGSPIIKCRRAAEDAAHNFGEAIVCELGKYPVELSPIGHKDFDLAKSLVIETANLAKSSCFQELSLLDQRMPNGVSAEDFPNRIRQPPVQFSRSKG